MSVHASSPTTLLTRSEPGARPYAYAAGIVSIGTAMRRHAQCRAEQSIDQSCTHRTQQADGTRLTCVCMCIQCTSHQLHLMFVCHAIAAATGRSHRAHRARAATGTRTLGATRARAATGMGHRPRDDRRTRSHGPRAQAHAQPRHGAQRRDSSGAAWRRDGSVCHGTAALVRAQPQKAQGAGRLHRRAGRALTCARLNDPRGVRGARHDGATDAHRNQPRCVGGRPVGR